MSSQAFEAIRISEHVYWVGAIDWSIRDFHGYQTSRGTTYNAYLVVADKVTLIETVKHSFCDEMLSRIASVVDPSRIDTIVSLHAELDHAGSLPDVIALTHPEKVLASKAGVAALAAHFDLGAPVEAVANGSTVQLGGARFTFHETRMVHWPESMFAWLEDDGVLFSQDAFGMHLASYERFTDQVARDAIDRETAKYFANILMPLSDVVSRAVTKLGDAIRTAKVIATNHGPIWRSGIQEIAQRYLRWCERPASRKVVIAFDSMWESTAVMARAIGEGVMKEGASATITRMGPSHRSDVATELLDAGALLVGSPNLNGQVLPTIADLLSYLKGLKPKNLIGGAFGSYGWSPSSTEQLQAALREMKVEPVEDPCAVKFVPRHEDLLRCRQLGERVGNKLAQTVS